MARKRGGSFRRGLLVLALAAGALGVVLLVRAAGSQDPPARRERLTLTIDSARAAESLAEYIRMETATPPPVPRDPRPAYLEMIIERYADPMELEHQVFGGRSLLLRWRAGEEDTGPLLLLSHSDVVPVAEGELDGWTHPPFAGVVDDGYVWGRGAIDDKGATIAQLEAIAALQAAGLTPRRDVFLLINPDEEIGGEGGAARVIQRHWDRLEEPYAVLDEGSFVADDFIPNARLVPIAVGEKHYVTITLSVNGAAGHASMPRESDAPRVLSVALGRLAELELEPRILPAMDEFLARVSDRMSFGSRIALRNRWLLGGVVNDILAERPASNAMIRDTFALTMLEAGVKDNVIPARAQATINLRLLPGSSVSEVLARIEQRIDDPRVQIDVVTDQGDSPVAPIEGEVWTRLETALASAYPEGSAVIAPMITPGTMDARYFAARGVPTYRLVPFVLDANERGRMHGIDERISIDNLEEAARVYAHLMRYW